LEPRESSSSLQESFDSAYKEAFRASRRKASIRAFALTCAAYIREGKVTNELEELAKDAEKASNGELEDLERRLNDILKTVNIVY